MTDLREAAQMALDALEEFCEHGAILRPLERREALRVALAEQADIQYEVWQHDEWQAGSNSLEETMRYAHQYAEDGSVKVQEVTRRVICKIEN